MAYRVSINTDAYKPRKATANNWESGTMNDFMEAINGKVFREKNLKHLEWRLGIICGGGFRGKDEDYAEFTEWFNQPRNKIEYLDRLCGFKRE